MSVRSSHRSSIAAVYVPKKLLPNKPTLQYRDDWKFVAMVVDRVLLYGFFGITLGGTIGSQSSRQLLPENIPSPAGILFSAPTVFERVDEHKHLQKLIQLYKQGLPTNDTFIMPPY